MKIVISLSYYEPNISGITTYVKNLSDGLVQKGHEIVILTSRHNYDLPLEEKKDKIKIIRVPVDFRIGKGPIMLRLPFTAFSYIKKADVVNCHLPQFESVILVILAKLMGKRVILTHHTDLSGWRGFANQLSEKAVYAAQFMSALLSDVVIVYTKDYADHSAFLRHFKDKLKYIHPPIKAFPVDKKYMTTLKKLIYARFIIGFSGRIAQQKGLEYLLESIPFIRRTMDDFKIVLAGPYKEIIGENKIKILMPLIEKYKKNIVLLGPIPHEKIFSFYSLIDVLVLPSDDRLESFGFVQVEAMLSGCPVIATNLPGVRIPIQKTGMGEIVNSRDSKGLAIAICRILKKKKEYRKDTREVEDQFNYQKTIDSYEMIFS